MKRLLTAAGLAAGVAGLLHAAPAVAFVPQLRNRFLPGLAGVGRPGQVALTFDDGPHPEATPLVLQELARHGVRATFFVLGHELARHPDLGRRIAAEGHELAVHGWDHTCLLLKRRRVIRRELDQTANLIEDLTGTRPRWFRAPYGVFSTGSLRAATDAGLTPVLWTCWGFDWTATATADSVLSEIHHRLADRGTILLHDSDVAAKPECWRSTVAALPRLFADCARLGLKPVPLRDHL
ncbi:polysaccharide deacetylase family protein [Pseudonocardiaceae bacterium YIM PH 21723]|nr:polysaccharide deacetylase family protein [Pseudonocardiaceae bacterium YIM PH 21723]